MTKKLVIHPRDPSTDFLIPVYKGLMHTTVVRGEHSKEDVMRLIKEHDQIIMLGHGSSSGLLSVGQFETDSSFIIDRSFADELRTHDNSVFVWCFANKFVAHHGLPGYYTGNFISEMSEAWWLDDNGVQKVTEDLIHQSNSTFAAALGHALMTRETADEIWEHMNETYYLPLARINVVSVYNGIRLGVFKNHD